MPAIEELKQRRCRLLLLTHLGRPRHDGSDYTSLTLEPIRRRLEKVLGSEVKLLKSLRADEANTVVSGLEAGGTVLLPNVRLDEREEAGSDKFARELAELGEAYVNEAFSVSHRDHTSVAKVPRLLPSCAGRRTVSEYYQLSELVSQPARPYVAIVSGAKVETKVKLLDRLLDQVDRLCLGGVIANTFLAVQGKGQLGAVDTNLAEAARRLLAKASGRIELPEDVVIGPADGQGSSVKTVPVEHIPRDANGLWDIGPVTVRRYLKVLKEAATIMWNGPLGMFEVDAYAEGTSNIARRVATFSSRRVVGGGDTVRALERLGLTNQFDHVSVGGGAMVAFLEGVPMPGLEPLMVSDKGR